VTSPARPIRMPPWFAPWRLFCFRRTNRFIRSAKNWERFLGFAPERKVDKPSSTKGTSNVKWKKLEQVLSLQSSSEMSLPVLSLSIAVASSEITAQPEMKMAIAELE
jgi:hypothetical protein